MDTAGGQDRILGTHREIAFAICLRVLRHRQDAEDACQEALLKIAAHGPGQIEPVRPTAWVHQIALRTAIDHHRTRLRRKAREDRAAEQASPRPEEADSMVEVAEALAQLPQEERTLLVDHFFGRKTLRALADERGCSEPAVWKRVEKSKDRLRKALKAAAPAAVLALNGFLEAAERPARWNPRHIALTAAVPAIVVIGLAGIGMQQRAGPEPAPRAGARTEIAMAAVPLPAQALLAAPAAPGVQMPKTSQAVPPYPYRLPPPHWSEARSAAWIKLERTPFDLSAENMLLHEILEDLSAKSAVPIRLAPDVPVPTSPVTLKVKDLMLRSILKLLVTQYGMDVELGSDGTVWVGSAEAVPAGSDPVFQEIQSARLGLDNAVRSMDSGIKGVPIDPTWEILRSLRFSIAPGDYTLCRVVDRLREESGMNFHLTVGLPAGNPELRPFPGGVRTLEEYLQAMAAAWNVGWAPRNGLLLIAEPGRAAEEMDRERKDQQAIAAWAARLDQPALDPFPTTIYQLADALARDTGLKVVPTEKAWGADIRASGERWKAVLEKLPAQGFRWLLRHNTVYIDR